MSFPNVRALPESSIDLSDYVSNESGLRIIGGYSSAVSNELLKHQHLMSLKTSTLIYRRIHAARLLIR
jgi:hypothetical protein